MLGAIAGTALHLVWSGRRVRICDLLRGELQSAARNTRGLLERLTLRVLRGISEHVKTHFRKEDAPMFGCGESLGRGELMYRDEFAQATYAPRADRLRLWDGKTSGVQAARS